MPTIPFLGIYPREIKTCSPKKLHTNVHISIIHDIPQHGNNQNIHQLTNQQNVLFSYKGILFPMKRGATDKCYNMNEL